MARSHDRNRTCDLRITKEPSSSPPAKLRQGFRDLPPLDPSFLLVSRTTSPPRQKADPETLPSFPQSASLLRIPALRLRKEPEIQLYLLPLACFSQVEPIVNSSRTQQGWSSFSTWSVVITNKTPVGAAKPFRTFSNPESVTPFWLGATSFVLSVAPLRAARI